MLPERKTKTNIGVGTGIILKLSAIILVRYGIIPPELGTVIWAFAVVFFTWGCMNYAEGKGSSKWMGLLGLLSIIGLLGLVLLPDRHKEKK